MDETQATEYPGLSISKRPRSPEWSTELNFSPTKRRMFEKESYCNQEPHLLQPWSESPRNSGFLNSPGSGIVVPRIELSTDHTDIPISDQTPFDKNLDEAGEKTLQTQWQYSNLDSSASTYCDQYVLDNMESTSNMGDLAMDSTVEEYTPFSNTSDVYLGTVSVYIVTI
jgi:hypothetical protein